MKQSNPIATTMLKWILSIFIGVFSFFFTAKAFSYSFPTHTQTVAYGFNGNNNGHYNHDIHLTWHKEPVDGWGMFAMYYFSFQAGVGGYTGLQKTTVPGRPKTAIFSIWDVAGRQTAMPVPGTVCQRFGHEGSGTMCILPFDWKADTEYKMRVWRILNSNTGYSEKWGAWVINVKTEEETMIGMIELYNANNQVGYGMLSNQGLMSATEFFTGPSNADCSNLPEFNITWRGPFGNNGSINPGYARGIYNTSIGTPCPQTNFTTNSVFSVSQYNGSKVTKVTPDDKYLWSHYDINKFNQIDCVFNWAEKQYPDVLKQSDFKQKKLSESNFNNYYRDYRKNGKGSAIIVDTVSDKVIKHDSGGINTLIGNFADVRRNSNCQ